MSTEGDERVAAAEDEAAPERYISHLKNVDAFSWIIRWGILFFLFSTFVLLLNADIGSGVTADSVMMQDGEVQEVNQILNVSVISSVGKLWDAKSYPLAIFIAITSIGWPYIKLAMATFAWVMPYTNPRKRELLIEIIDALGKWSFVDIMVLVEIMVAFRSSVVLAPGLSLEIVIVAQWGFYGFVIATMMSLLSTHVILHYHRKVHYHNPESIAGGDAAKNDDENPNAIEEVAANADADPADPADENANAEKAVASIESPCGMKKIGGLSPRFLKMALKSLAGSIVFYLAGVLTETFEVTSTRGDVSVSTSYSIASIGMAIPEAYIDSGHTGTRFIQVMWFFLGIAMPLWCSVLFVILYAVPSLSKERMKYIFTMAEVTFAWSCAEVLLLSTIFAVLQMPIFGAGLVENNCTTCFVITTQILPQFSLLCIGTCMNVAVNVWLYRKTHSILYQTK
mmetsp:Transcript_9007/g.26768  ORF Transcript_9007/g.26768 Transcript_9007/m.26768 type:complete len:454 (+) Transcript_9007:184-1545(+)